MSSEIKDDATPEVGQELDRDVQADIEGATEKLATEGRSGMDDLSAAERARMQRLQQGGRSGITGEFGTVAFVDTAATSGPTEARSLDEIAYTSPLADKSDGGRPGEKGDQPAEAKKEERTPASMAAEFEKQGRASLDAVHKDLKTTTDGSTPRVLEYEAKFKVTTGKSALELAEERLGAAATKDQKEAYARALQSANGDYSGEINKKIPAGTEIKLPGQTSDGGIYYKGTDGATHTEWIDGTTLRTKPDGSGNAFYRTKDNWMVEVRWDPRDATGSYEERSKGDDVITTDGSGRVVEKRWVDDKDDYEVGRISHTDGKGRTFVQDFKSGQRAPEKVTITNPDNSTVELRPGKDGDYVSADGKTGIDGRFNVYERTTASDGSVTKSYENGYKEKLDAKGRLLQQEGKDDWGRAYTYEYKAGEKTPHTAKITPKDGEPPVELKRGRGNTYSADYLDASGKKIGSITLGADGRLVYKNDRDKSQRTELKNGTVLEKKELPGGGSQVTMTDKGETQVTEYNKKNERVSETAITKDGRKFIKSFEKGGKGVGSVTIESPDGSKTEMSYDKHAEAFRGERKDASGKVLEHVTLLEDKLVYVDATTGAVRAEKYSKRTEDSLIPRFIPGEYDRDTGKFTYRSDDGTKTVESFAPGRSDRVKSDGTIEGTTVSGDKSTLKPNGEATVEHSDGTGVRMNPDCTIDRWGPKDSDNASRERLSPTEEKFVKAHADIDRRDVAEIHRRFGGDQAKLEAFYKELEKIDGAKNLNDVEKSALRKDLMHHVAFPSEIYQGRTPSCNVSVIERDMAMTSPDKYVGMVVKAVSDGEITTADGTRVPLDPDNLKMPDSSGRDLASRIFQTAAIQAEFYPRKEFRNSEDGVGRLYPVPFNASDKPLTFQGMTIAHIAETRYKLTGEQKAVTEVSSVNDLVAAYEANGGGPMIIAVDGSRDPFGGGGPIGKGSNLNHVVTITHIDKGPPTKVYVANQWGLNNDHSTPATAIDGSKLVDNMKLRVKVGGQTVTGAGMVLSAGDHTKGYEVKQGKIVERKAAASVLAKGRAIIPGE